MRQSLESRRTNSYKLRKSVGRTSNTAEIEKIQSLETAGYVVCKNGWPDLLAWHPDRKVLRFVEVKPKKICVLSSRQKMVADILYEALGIEVELWAPDPE